MSGARGAAARHPAVSVSRRPRRRPCPDPAGVRHMLPWQTPELIRHNLGVLARLKLGEKLSVLKDGEGSGGYENLGRHGHGLRERFQVSSSAHARSKKGETIKNRE